VKKDNVQKLVYLKPEVTVFFCEIKLNANLMQLGNFIDVFLARHVTGTYAHHQEH